MRPENAVSRGNKIYDEELKQILEPEHNGKFVAIAPETGEYVIGKNLSQTKKRAKELFQPKEKPLYEHKIFITKEIGFISLSQQSKSENAAQKRKSGRKKLTETDKREVRFSVYVNYQEAELVKKYAEDAGTNPTDYLRRAGLNQMKKVVPGVNREKWRELGNLVGLLNQIAKGVNTGQVQNVKISLLEEIKNEVQKLRIELISDNKHN